MFELQTHLVLTIVIGLRWIILKWVSEKEVLKVSLHAETRGRIFGHWWTYGVYKTREFCFLEFDTRCTITFQTGVLYALNLSHPEVIILLIVPVNVCDRYNIITAEMCVDVHCLVDKYICSYSVFA